ncbi:MAG: sugar transferase [Bacteroidetes bacterium]|nr:sugar transferase [Fibrella sp.]
MRAFGKRAAVCQVTTTEEALAMMQQGLRVDLLIINESAGALAFSNQLKTNPFYQSLPVIITATVVTADLRRQALQARALDIFPSEGAEDSIGVRIDYLMQRKQLDASSTTKPVSVTVNMPPGKRLFDIVFAGTLLLCISPLMLVVAALIKLDSPGPVFYRSRRVGAGYRMFDMYKFRTMRPNADQLISAMAGQNIYNKPAEIAADGLCPACLAAGTGCQRQLFLDNEPICENVYIKRKKDKATFAKFHADPRVTRLGRLLRDLSIDELPQFLNILKGDMSVVGNRPLPPYEAEKLTTTAYAQRFAAPAGLTGLWQVTKRGRSTLLSDHERIQLDIDYANQVSLRTDFRILVKTLWAVWQKESM